MRILLLQLKRIGDLILTTPVIRAIREARPDAHITLVTDSSCAGLLGAIPVDDTFVFDRRRRYAWFRRGLAAYRGDWCLDFTGTDRSTLFAAFAACRHRGTYERFRKKFLRKWVFSDFVDSSVRERHTADHHVDLLRPLGITRENVPLDLHVPPAVTESTRALLAQRGVQGPFAIIHAGTARPEKYWAAPRWAEIAAFLWEQYQLPTVLTGSPNAEEQAHLQAIKAGLKTPIHDLSGATDLTGLAALIGDARLFCGVDTAAMHLADAMWTPTVALFGPTNPYHWRPRHTRNVVLRALTPEPFKPGQKGGPMEEISSAAVRDAVQSLLG